MQPICNAEPEALDADVGHELRPCSFEIFWRAPSAHHLSMIEGTIAAAETATSDQCYWPRSEGLVHTAPLREAVADLPAARPQLRPKDLLVELESINAQIHHIMSQVEHAVSKLTVSR